MIHPFGRTKWAKIIPYVSLIPALIFYLTFYFGPSMATVIFSFTNVTGIPGVPWEFIGFENYREFFKLGSSSEVWEVFFRTIIFAVCVVFFQNVIALFLAVVINKKIPGHAFYRSLIFMPVILGVTVVGYMWIIALNPIDGPVQQILNFFNTRSNFLGSIILAFPIVIAIQIWFALGYSLVIYLAGLQAIPGDLYEAGHIDGATQWQEFWHITFPLLAPSITVNVLLAVIGSLQVFDTMFVLTGGAFKTRTLALLMFQEAFSGSQRQGYASAIAVMLFLIVLTVVAVFQYYLRKREEEI